MKAKPKKHFIKIETWTPRFLGTAGLGQALLRMLESMDGSRWIPDRWNTVEPVRKPFSNDCEEEIINRWTKDQPPGSGKVWSDLMFLRKKPRALIQVHAQRWGRAELNWVWMDVEARPFSTLDGPSRLKEILKGFVNWSGGVYGTVFYSGQAHKRTVQMTPLQRLDQAYWLNFFGQPYLEMFGRERVLNTPCYSVEEFEGHGVFLQAAPRFDSSEVTDSDEMLIRLEEYLGPDAFAGRGYPQIPCRVPNFDLSETMPPSPSAYCQ
jgi:hypothetical protein